MLRHCATTLRQGEEVRFPHSVSELMDEKRRPDVLEQQAVLLGRPESVVVGTLFAKRYSVFCMGLLAAASLYDLRLAASPEAVRFSLTPSGTMAYETTLMTSSLLLPVESDEERSEAINEYSAYMQQHVGQLVAAVASHTGASVQIMWSLISHNVQMMYARIEQENAFVQSGRRRELIRLDRAAVFEPKTGNKLAFKLRRFEHAMLQRIEPVLVRRYCCLAYKANRRGQSEGYCSTCPKISDEERVRMLAGKP